jgi:hypothetical protein
MWYPTNDNDVIFKLRLITNDIYAYIGLIMLVFGTIGNVCNIVVFILLHPLSKLASTWLLVASFVGSQIVLSTAVLSRVIFGLSGIDPLVSSIIWCKIRWVLGPLAGTTALTCISLASIDRYFVTSRQINRHQWITIQRARYMILIVVIFWLIAAIPNGIYYTSPSCTITNSVYALFSPAFILTTYSTAPSLILAVFCILTWFNLHDVRARIIRTNRIQRQVNKMMIAQIFVVLLTSVPSAITQIYMLVTRTTVKSSLRQAQETLLTAALSMFGYTTHAGAFYAYLIASRSYRNNVKAIILRQTNRLNRVLPQMA